MRDEHQEVDAEIDDTEDALRYGDRYRDLDEPKRCVLGLECCCPHPFHDASECFSAEMMEAYYADIGGEG